MTTDPTTLLALALFVGILGLLVLIMPLLILFWSQMEPQLAGLVSGETDSARAGSDEYPTQAVLPRLMKSFGDMAEIEKERSKSEKKTARRKPAGGKLGTNSRSKARSVTKTVKVAPAKAKKSTTKPKTKTAVKIAEAKPKSKSKASARRAPAGAKRDQVLGIIYTKKPKDIDDLKEIKGVAKVIEGKLQKAGIYTFRQIVEWDDVAIDAFSEKLAFKGRIRNEGWQKQCAKFHKAKYGEKIG